jgi:sulfur carrier protein
VTDVVVNGEQRAIATGATVADIVATVTASPTGCAVAVNDVVVPRPAWSGRVLEPDDRIEVLTAVQGG